MVTVALIESVNQYLALGTILLQIATLALLYDYLFNRALWFGAFVQQFAYRIMIVLSAGGTALTLVYSEVFGFVPCGLCWLQRIALYPLLVIFVVGHIMKDRLAALYGIVLSAFGAIISLYQHYIQMGGSEFITCPVAGSGANCAERILFEFGYITFPLMSFSLFVFFIVLLLIYRKQTRNR